MPTKPILVIIAAWIVVTGMLFTPWRVERLGGSASRITPIATSITFQPIFDPPAQNQRGSRAVIAFDVLAVTWVCGVIAILGIWKAGLVAGIRRTCRFLTKHWIAVLSVLGATIVALVWFNLPSPRREDPTPTAAPTWDETTPVSRGVPLSELSDAQVFGQRELPKRDVFDEVADKIALEPDPLGIGSASNRSFPTERQIGLQHTNRSANPYLDDLPDATNRPGSDRSAR